MITTTLLKARVARGIEWINTHPEYLIDLARVNPETLRSMQPQRCVLGQGYAGPLGTFYSGYAAIKDRLRHEFSSSSGDGGYDKTKKFLLDHGFDVTDIDGWDRLDQAWKEALTEQAQA